jgi:hypothetical protein
MLTSLTLNYNGAWVKDILPDERHHCWSSKGWYSPIAEILRYIDAELWHSWPMLPEGLPNTGMIELERLESVVVPMVKAAPQELLLLTSRFFTGGGINRWGQGLTWHDATYLGLDKPRALRLADETSMMDMVVFKIYERMT